MKAGDSATASARPESFAKVTEVAAGPKAFAFPALIGDIGGTNVRFATVDSAGRTFSLRRGAVADFAGLNDAIARLAFKDLKEKPLTAVLAVAGPVSGGTATLTNSGWWADVGELIARFGFGEVVLVNDWIATALALPTLRAGEIDPIGGVRPGHGGTQVALVPARGWASPLSPAPAAVGCRSRPKVGMSALAL